MTVQEDAARSSYTGDGIQTVFPITFGFSSAGDLEVTIDGVVTSNYSVVASDVVMNTAPAAGEILVITRDMTFSQQLDYVENDNFPAESHEGGLDKLTYIVQQLREEAARRLGVPVNFDPATLNLEPPPTANNYLKWSGDGLSLLSVPGEPTDLTKLFYDLQVVVETFFDNVASYGIKLGTTGNTLLLENVLGQLLEIAAQNEIHFYLSASLKAKIVDDGVEASGGIVYLGDDDTNGSWRFDGRGTDLLIQRRESGNWVTKSTVPA